MEAQGRLSVHPRSNDPEPDTETASARKCLHRMLQAGTDDHLPMADAVDTSLPQADDWIVHHLLDLNRCKARGDSPFGTAASALKHVCG